VSTDLGEDIISDLKGLFFPPNIILPLVEKERAPKSSHRLSSGMCVLMGAKSRVGEGSESSCPLSALEGPAECGGRLGDFGDLGAAETRPISGGAPALSLPSIFFCNRFDFVELLGPIPKRWLSVLVIDAWRVGDGDGDGVCAGRVGDSATVSALSVGCGIESFSGGGATRLLLVRDRDGLRFCSSFEYSDGASAMLSNSF
jgi:hypothetical protein